MAMLHLIARRRLPHEPTRCAASFRPKRLLFFASMISLPLVSAAQVDRQGAALQDGLPATVAVTQLSADWNASCFRRRGVAPVPARANDYVVLTVDVCGRAVLGAAEIVRDGGRISISQPYCLDLGQNRSDSDSINLGRLPEGEYTIEYSPRNTCRPDVSPAPSSHTLLVLPALGEPRCLPRSDGYSIHLAPFGTDWREVEVRPVPPAAACDTQIHAQVLASNMMLAEEATLARLNIPRCVAGTNAWLLRLPVELRPESPRAYLVSNGNVVFETAKGTLFDPNPGPEMNRDDSLVVACLASAPGQIEAWEPGAWESQRKSFKAAQRMARNQRRMEAVAPWLLTIGSIVLMYWIGRHVARNRAKPRNALLSALAWSLVASWSMGVAGVGHGIGLVPMPAPVAFAISWLFLGDPVTRMLIPIALAAWLVPVIAFLVGHSSVRRAQDAVASD
jgi:hypothetical protein